MDSLSFGQKAVVILTLITNLGDNHGGMPPLIIDQPEDHLDNHYIFSNLVTDLRKIKGKRQVILVTHNPNIVVSGDAEQAICLASDGNRGWVEIAGSIDRPRIQNFIVEVKVIERGCTVIRSSATQARSGWPKRWQIRCSRIWSTKRIRNGY